MCGIAGVVFADGRPVDGGPLLEAVRKLKHRGPDEEGVWTGPGAALGVERLSVVDLETGHQPVANETGDVVVAFNGEIYNHGGLRPPLGKKGHRFKTKSDTEVLVHLYEERGDALVEDLDGMFAFAIWDAPRRRLLLARDPFGIKPLYYAELAGALWFASETRALAGVGGIDRSIDPEALQSFFLLGHVPHPRTVWKGIRKLPPGARLVYENGASRVERFWAPRFGAGSDEAREVLIDRTGTALEEAVRLQLAADVPVGVLLSGGIDSSLVAEAAVGTQPDLETFSVGFEGAPAHDETAHALRVAGILGTRHQEEKIGPPDRDGLARLAARFGEPFADSSAVAMDRLCAFARSRVKVVLSGEGGDELFGGYSERYVWDPVADDLGKMSPWLRRGLHVAGRVAGAVPIPSVKNAGRRARKFAAGTGLLPADRYLLWFSLFPDPIRRELLGDAFREIENPYASSFAETEGDPLLHRLCSADLALTMPSDMLTKADRASMGHGLELRVPFLSRAVWETARRLPVSMRVKGRSTKIVLRKLAKRRFPASIWRRKKQGFEVPVADWMLGPWRGMMTDLCEGTAGLAGGMLQRKPLADLWRRLQSGERHAAHPLYAVLMFTLWQEQV